MDDRLSRSPVDTVPVEIRVIADVAQLPMVRGIAEAVALIAEFTLDRVADIRLGVDEVASMLITGATPESVLACGFTIGDTEMKIRVRSVSERRILPDPTGFGWQMLRTLSDSLAAAQHPFDVASSGYPTTVEFSVLRGTAGVARPSRR